MGPARDEDRDPFRRTSEDSEQNSTFYNHKPVKANCLETWQDRKGRKKVDEIQNVGNSTKIFAQQILVGTLK